MRPCEALERAPHGLQSLAQQDYPHDRFEVIVVDDGGGLDDATLQSEYVIPRDALEYYLRGLLNYQPENDNFTTGFERDSFALLNLYAGVRSADGRWDLTLWAKNALDEDTLLQLDSEWVLAGFSSGYRGVSVQPEREIGLSLRYAFGSG